MLRGNTLVKMEEILTEMESARIPWALTRGGQAREHLLAFYIVSLLVAPIDSVASS
jgi:hypothetical protein